MLQIDQRLDGLIGVRENDIIDFSLYIPIYKIVPFASPPYFLGWEGGGCHNMKKLESSLPEGTSIQVEAFLTGRFLKEYLPLPQMIMIWTYLILAYLRMLPLSFSLYYDVKSKPPLWPQLTQWSHELIYLIRWCFHTSLSYSTGISFCLYQRTISLSVPLLEIFSHTQ